MSLSTLTPQDVAALKNGTPESFMQAVRAEGRSLREGANEMQLRNLRHEHKSLLKEVASKTRFSEEEINGLWDDKIRHGQTTVKKLKEAVSESAMPQLLRFGVQNFLFDGYAAVPTIYPDLVRIAASSGAEELYAPLYGSELPQTVAPGQEYGDSRLQGLDLHVPNLKKGRIVSFERELQEDDRTGQIVSKAGDMGERMRYVEEQDVCTAFTNTNNLAGGRDVHDRDRERRRLRLR